MCYIQYSVYSELEAQISANICDICSRVSVYPWYILTNSRTNSVRLAIIISADE